MGALPFARASSRARSATIARRVCARVDAAIATESALFVDVAISGEGRATRDARTAEDVRSFPEHAVVVLTHAGPMAGAFLEERPIAACDAVLTFGRRPRALDDDGWRAVIEQYRAARTLLASRGARAFCISLDDGGLLASTLSPRTHPLADEPARLSRVQSVVRALLDDGPLGVALTVEERVPGGIDAHLGIAVARALVDDGASYVIASRDAHAFDRDAPEDVDTGDPALATAAWLIGRVSVPVFGQCTTSDPHRASLRAQTIGLAGFVDDTRGRTP